jgi:uroporphyrinogen decarboxylase
MNHRERVISAFEFEKPDMVPLEIHPCPGGLYQHGEKLRSLLKTLDSDFTDYTDVSIPAPDPKYVDASGKYHACYTDAWGTVWEELAFGMMGQDKERPLDDISCLKNYTPPLPDYSSPERLRAVREEIGKSKAAGRFAKTGWIEFFHRLCHLRKFEDVLMDIADDTDEINAAAGMIIERNLKDIDSLISCEPDAIQFGDDFGTQKALIMSPESFRRFIKPRLARMIEPIKKAGIRVMFHSCGYIYDILGDLKEIGVDSVWPQLAVHDMEKLAKHCRELKLASALHLNVSEVMSRGTPEMVRENFKKMNNAFKPEKGGFWHYIEVYLGFPFENIQTLVELIARGRR